VAEESVSSGTRRIVALTGEKARENAARTRRVVDDAAGLLHCRGEQLVEAARELVLHARQLKKQHASGSKHHTKSASLAPGGSAAASATLPGGGSAAAAGKEETYATVRETARQLARVLNVAVGEVAGRIAALQSECAVLEQELAEQSDVGAPGADDLLRRAFDADGVAVIVSEAPGANTNTMRNLIDQVRQKNSSAAVVLASIQGADRITLLAGMGRDVVARGFSAGDWVRSVAPVVDGGGGGKPDMAQAGGKRPDKLNEALDAARQYMLAATAT
jgi:alanyl-tRNA synthetase